MYALQRPNPLKILFLLRVLAGGYVLDMIPSDSLFPKCVVTGMQAFHRDGLALSGGFL